MKSMSSIPAYGKLEKAARAKALADAKTKTKANDDAKSIHTLQPGLDECDLSSAIFWIE